jgi:hypothetical protein
MIILAIDPGITGALAFYNTEYREEVQVHDMPVLDGDVDPHELKAIMLNCYPHLAIIEHVSPMPKEGVRSVWRFSAAFTTACVVVKLMRVPLILVSPAKWKHAMFLKGGKEGKEQARERVIETFPACARFFNLKKHHGRAEAALLAVYASGLPNIRRQNDEDTRTT